MSAKILWFTGLSGSGKSTLSTLLFKHLLKNNNKLKLKIIDGDNFRKKTRNKKNFSRNGIFINNLSIINHIDSVKAKYDFILVSVISPLLKTRVIAKKIFGKNYFEIYVKCKISSLKKRDPKGLYKNERIKMIGVNSDIKYEKSSYKKIILDTDKNTKKELIKKIFKSII